MALAMEAPTFCPVRTQYAAPQRLPEKIKSEDNKHTHIYTYIEAQISQSKREKSMSNITIDQNYKWVSERGD